MLRRRASASACRLYALTATPSRSTRVRWVRWRPGSPTRGGTARSGASTSTPTRCSSQLTDELLYHGDVNAALRRMMQDGMRGPDGERLARPARPARQAPPGAPGAPRPPRPRRRVRRDRRRARRHRRRGTPRDRQRRARRRRRAATSAAPQTARETAAERNMRLDLHARRPRRQGPRAQRLRLRVARGAAALRADDGQAARAADAAGGRPDVRGHAEHDARATCSA